MSAYNKRFGEIGVKVIARISARRLTVSDNPNFGTFDSLQWQPKRHAVAPQLRQAAGMLEAMRRKRRRKKTDLGIKYNPKMLEKK